MKNDTDYWLKQIDKVEESIKRSDSIIKKEQEKLNALKEKRSSMASNIILVELKGIPVRKAIEQIRIIAAEDQDQEEAAAPTEELLQAQPEEAVSSQQDAEQEHEPEAAKETENSYQQEAFDFDTQPAENSQGERTENGYNMGSF